jgi:hypothetical protein
LMLAQRLWADLNSISSGRSRSIKDGINPCIWANPSQYIYYYNIIIYNVILYIKQKN